MIEIVKEFVRDIFKSIIGEDLKKFKNFLGGIAVLTIINTLLLMLILILELVEVF